MNATEWSVGTLGEANSLLHGRHYLGATRSARHVFVGCSDGRLVAAQVWKLPTSRRLPADGSWLELSRWCLTPDAGENAGSQMHRYVTRALRADHPDVTTFLSYSDPSHGHTGALYRACNWLWSPTWHRLRPPPSGLGTWDGHTRQAVKDRWIFPLRPDVRRPALLAIDDAPAVRRYLSSDEYTSTTKRWPTAIRLVAA